MARSLNVYLLTVEPPERRVYYSEVVRQTPEEVSSDRGRLGAVGRWFRGLRARWQRSQGPAAKSGRKVWSWLHSRTHPDELLYSRLRNARQIAMYHPSSMTDLEATRDWCAFLERGQWRHAPWFLLNLAVAPASLFLALLPGPNVIGYWFAYRAVHHLFILVGLYRARNGRVAIRFLAAEALDRPIEVDADPVAEADRLVAVGLARNPQKLGDFLRRQGLPGVPGAPAAGAPAPE